MNVMHYDHNFFHIFGMSFKSIANENIGVYLQLPNFLLRSDICS